MTNSALQAAEEVRPCESSRPGPIPVEGPDVLDWEVSIVAPPAHRSGTLRVALDYAGRGQPITVDDPWAEG